MSKVQFIFPRGVLSVRFADTANPTQAIADAIENILTKKIEKLAPQKLDGSLVITAGNKVNRIEFEKIAVGENLYEIRTSISEIQELQSPVKFPTAKISDMKACMGCLSSCARCYIYVKDQPESCSKADCSATCALICTRWIGYAVRRFRAGSRVK